MARIRVAIRNVSLQGIPNHRAMAVEAHLIQAIEHQLQLAIPNLGHGRRGARSGTVAARLGTGASPHGIAEAVGRAVTEAVK